ncbi:MAG: hypothetical protein KBF73_06465 [Flavobacteriales bacterium]|nr:hypothetical protein [Flavobacteriales bacterium]
MINPDKYPRVWPELIPALEAALLKYEEAEVKLAEFKKKYTSVKNKLKRLEKHVAQLDEAADRGVTSSLLNNGRLAENKFNLIDKKLKDFHAHRGRYSKSSLKVLQSSKATEPSTTRWHISHVGGHLNNVDSLLYVVADMLRIAKDHLEKVENHKKFIRDMKRRQARVRLLFPSGQ